MTDDLGLFNLLRQHHLLWNGRSLGVELHDELFHHFGIRRILRPFKDEVFPSDQLAAADEENLYTGLTVTARHGKHIRIQIVGREDDLLSLDNGLDGFELVAYCRSFLEAHLL